MELSEYADSIQDVYEKNIDDTINGLYDKSEDIPETYGDAWEDIIDMPGGSLPGEGKDGTNTSWFNPDGSINYPPNN